VKVQKIESFRIRLLVLLRAVQVLAVPLSVQREVLAALVVAPVAELLRVQAPAQALAALLVLQPIGGVGAEARDSNGLQPSM